MIPIMAIGQAAGVAAALSASQGVHPRDLDVALLQHTLLGPGRRAAEGVGVEIA